ncbi:hypothetical protein RchiOBHm_Chr2g0164601 [Rosa chinensis]|uniref:Uncharacterized protein n=1 Tax=Rosa chinensis TaxID=74649 RepID=A0A2P6S3K3_ROSCH|nr:hypothetical protein RchiOBHm_Chr2g0164601 [Rosa chinensis]
MRISLPTQLKILAFQLINFLGYVWYGCSLRKSWLLLISENKWLKSKAAECLVNWLFIRAVSGRSSGKVFGKSNWLVLFICGMTELDMRDYFA